MKVTIEIEDNLKEILERLYSSTQEILEMYVKKNFSQLKEGNNIKTPDIDGDLDYDGSIHQIVDQNVPVYNKELKDLWYLHDQKFETAYENAGVGDWSEENWMGAGIYFYLYQELRDWYENNSHDLTQKLYQKIRANEIAIALSNSKRGKNLHLPEL
jgi:hypothetical protein